MTIIQTQLIYYYYHYYYYNIQFSMTIILLLLSPLIIKSDLCDFSYC